MFLSVNLDNHGYTHAQKNVVKHLPELKANTQLDSKITVAIIFLHSVNKVLSLSSLNPIYHLPYNIPPTAVPLLPT